MKKLYVLCLFLMVTFCLVKPATAFAEEFDYTDYEIEDRAVSVHCRVRVGIWSMEESDMVDNVVWSSSNEKIATVNQDGWVTGKSAGNVIITGIYEGHEFSCNIRVTKNKTPLEKRYSKKASKYKKKKLIFKFSEASIDEKGTLTLKGHFINTYGKKVKSVRNVKFSMYFEGKRFKKTTVKNITLNTKSKKSKKITLKFKNIDPKVDLTRGYTWITYSGGKIKY